MQGAGGHILCSAYQLQCWEDAHDDRLQLFLHVPGLLDNIGVAMHRTLPA